MPRMIGCCCCQPPIMEKRALVVPLAEGDVLELGIGGGANLALYDPARVRSVSGVDPSPELLDRARDALPHARVPVDIRAGVAEALPYPDGRFDTVVTTYTLCSVGDPARALAEARRVLKPGGKLLFLEHGRAPDPGPLRWQRRIEPLWKRAMGNCHLSRPVADAILAAGFTVPQRSGEYMPGMPRWASWMEWGEARPS